MAHIVLISAWQRDFKSTTISKKEYKAQRDGIEGLGIGGDGVSGLGRVWVSMKTEYQLCSRVLVFRRPLESWSLILLLCLTRKKIDSLFEHQWAYSERLEKDTGVGAMAPAGGGRFGFWGGTLAHWHNPRSPPAGNCTTAHSAALQASTARGGGGWAKSRDRLHCEVRAPSGARRKLEDGHGHQSCLLNSSPHCLSGWRTK